MMNNLALSEKYSGADQKILVSESKNGLPVVQLNGYFLNSKYDPVREAKRYAVNNYKKNYLHVLFGLSFGYIANELIGKITDTDFLLIIEPNLDLFNLVKDSGNLDALIDHPRAFFLVGYELEQIEEEIKYLISKMGYVARIEMLVSPNYNQLFAKEINEVGQVITKNARLAVVNIGTIAVFSEIWQKNLLHNIYEAWKAQPFKVFMNKFSCPVIIASSGPSLTKQLDLLKTVREKEQALIIAAGSTINPLLKAGIKPHLVVSIDGGEANWKHFKDNQCDDIPLFYSLAVHKDIPGNHQGFKVVFNTGDEVLAKWVNETLGKDLGFVVGGASVANFCLFIAKRITSGPICFVGQDLAYTGNSTHAKGNKNYKDINLGDQLDTKKYLYVKGYYGEEVLSDYKFLSMKRVFEDMVTFFRKTGDQRPIVNSTEGGVYLEGIDNLDFASFVQEYCQNDYTQEFLEAFQPHQADEGLKERIVRSLETERENLSQVVKLAKRAIDILDGISRESELVDAKVLKRLDKLDEQLNELLKSNMIYYIIMPISFRINHLFQEAEQETPLEQARRILDKSEALYKQILRGTEKTLGTLEAILESSV